MNEHIEELIRAIKELSPLVWEAAVQRVYVQGWSNIGLAGAFLIVAVVFLYIARYSHNKALSSESYSDKEAYGTGMWMMVFFAGLCFIPIVGNFYWAIPYLFSPEWSAIQLIIEQIK